CAPAALQGSRLGQHALPEGENSSHASSTAPPLTSIQPARTQKASRGGARIRSNASRRSPGGQECAGRGGPRVAPRRGTAEAETFRCKVGQAGRKKAREARIH